MTPSRPLSLVALAFALFGVVLLVTPLVLVMKKIQTWPRVQGLWISGWGFLLIGAGTHFAYRGWSSLVVLGVLVTGAGHLMQRSAMKR